LRKAVGLWYEWVWIGFIRPFFRCIVTDSGGGENKRRDCYTALGSERVDTHDRRAKHKVGMKMNVYFL
jgi:hypothetical protein